jgi:hypothetical protein
LARCAIDFVLVDDLQAVVVDVLLVDQVDVLDRAVVALEYLDVVFLDARGLFDDAVVGAGNAGTEEALPLGVGELHLVELLQLAAQVGDQIAFRGDGQVFIGLHLQLLDEGLFQFGLGLIGGFPHTQEFGQEFGDDGALVGQRNRLVAARPEVFAHASHQRVACAQAGKTAEIAVSAPQFRNAMGQAQGSDARVVHHAPLHLAATQQFAQLRPVGRRCG